jgi:hypothetical protein
MGKSWRRDAKNDRWRKAKQQKLPKKFRPFNTEEKEKDEPIVDNCDRVDFLQ